MACGWSDFFASPAGRGALAWEAEAFARVVARQAGDRALQLGAAELDALAASPIAHRVLCCRQAPALAEGDLRGLLVAEDAFLPLAEGCASLVAWPHGFERNGAFAAQALAEIARVLAPGGLLVVSAFNASGPWSLRNRIPGARRLLPAHCEPLAPGAARERLAEAGLSVEGGRFGLYALGEPSGRRKAGRIDLAGDRWWPAMSNLWLLAARKRVPGMTLQGKAAFKPLAAGVAAHALAKAGQDFPCALLGRLHDERRP
ncbi:MAG: hypothetical protein HUK26_02890 [Duodenibacillus sp.]|nr:hypothetical protein [Duodenibacillus sp.]